jgi:hypothetical protein
VNGTPRSDAFAYYSEVTTAGTLISAGKPTIGFTGLTNAITLDPGNGLNSLRMLGTAGADTFTGTLQTTLVLKNDIGAALTGPIGNFSSLWLVGDTGNDTFDMTTDSAANANVHIDGGQPPGKKQGDTLNVQLTPGAKGKVAKAGTGVGTVSVTYNGGSTPFFSYEGTEAVKVLKP